MTDSDNRIHIELEGTPDEVRAALLRLRRHLREVPRPNVDAGALEIVLAEVLNNVVEHALAGVADGRIALTCDHDGQGWAVSVRDNGHPMPGGTLPAGKLPEIETGFHDLPEGGFGWSMVRTLAHDIHYERDGTWNALRFRLPG